MTQQDPAAIRPRPADLVGRSYDLCVIGGGINGVAIARDAALRGLTVVLLERRDLSSGTSAWSSRIVHGGLKYLEHLEVGLVRECVRDRRELLRDAPHLVRRYPMLIPGFRGDRRPWWLIRLGVIAHDVLKGRDPFPRGRSLGRAAVARLAPGLDLAALRGATLYHDGQVPWAERLAVELALDAAGAGADVVTRAEVAGFLTEDDRVTGVRVRDLSPDGAGTGAGAEDVTHEVRARAVVNAAGPWVDAVLGHGVPGRRRIGGTKGSHVVVDRFEGAPEVCTFFEAHADGRPMYLMPWVDRLLIGTTDLTFEGELDDLAASDDEIAYLLDETNRLYPGAGLTEADVLYSYAGVRPLPAMPGVTDNAKIPREHVIVDHAPTHRGLVSALSGKWTTHRALAEDVIAAAGRSAGMDVGRPATHGRPLPGAVDGADRTALEADLVARLGVDAAAATRLVDVYGLRAARIVALVAEDPALGEVVDAETGALAAEVVLAAREEWAHTTADVLMRRSMVGFNGEAGATAAPRVAAVLGAELGRGPDAVAADLADFALERARLRPRTPLVEPVAAAR
jgi:glycerol-3-phosphate dehydrogenase